MVRRRRNHRHHAGPNLGGAFGVPPGAKARAILYARNAMTSISRQSPQASALAEFTEEANSVLELGLVDGEASDWMDVLEPRPPAKDLWLRLQHAVNAAAARIGTTSISPLLRQVCQDIALDDLDAEIIQLMVDYSTYRMTMRLWDKLSDAEGEPTCLRLDARFVGMMLGKDEGAIGHHLSASSALRESGLLRMDQTSGVSVLPRLLFLMRQPASDSIDARSALLGPQQRPELTLEDFAHIGTDTERVVALLRGALGERTKGVVIVLYGPPGTGKTALARTIAAYLGVPLHSVGEADDEGGEPCRQERLAELQMAQRLMGNSPPALLLLDEAEDVFGEPNDLFALFGGRRSNGGSKVFMHRLLENGLVPLILTANSLAAFGEAVLRRMTACVEVRVPPVHVRTKIWAHAAAAEGIAAEPAELAQLARQLPAAPALARSSMRAARLAGGDKNTIRWALSGVAKAMSGKPLPPVIDAVPFENDLVNADVDLPALADRLCAPDAIKNISLLLSGPSGSGKSAFARHLAERMGLEVVQKRASDLLGKYVGETEKRIAVAFAEAVDNRAFLIFDEADSLLGDRSGAHRNWEVSLVNEMLTWMESHPLPFCATTNLMERVDKAAMRRFLVKAKFQTLRADQCAMAFQRFFDIDPPRTIATLENLTPADFALVHKMASLQGKLDDPAFLMDYLEREQSSRFAKKMPMGFLH